MIPWLARIISCDCSNKSLRYKVLGFGVSPTARSGNGKSRMCGLMEGRQNTGDMLVKGAWDTGLFLFLLPLSFHEVNITL